MYVRVWRVVIRWFSGNKFFVGTKQMIPYHIMSSTQTENKNLCKLSLSLRRKPGKSTKRRKSMCSDFSLQYTSKLKKTWQLNMLLNSKNTYFQNYYLRYFQYQIYYNFTPRFLVFWISIFRYFIAYTLQIGKKNLHLFFCVCLYPAIHELTLNVLASHGKRYQYRDHI